MQMIELMYISLSEEESITVRICKWGMEDTDIGTASLSVLQILGTGNAQGADVGHLALLAVWAVSDK